MRRQAIALGTTLALVGCSAPIGRGLLLDSGDSQPALDGFGFFDTALSDTSVSDAAATETSVGAWNRVWPDKDHYVASHPTDVPPVKWLPCPSGRVGCEVMDTSWNPIEVSLRVAPTTHPQYWVGDKGYVTFIRRFGAEGERATDLSVVADVLSGKVVFAGRIGLSGYGSMGLSSRGLGYYVTDSTRASIFRQPYEGAAVEQRLANRLKYEDRPLWMADTTVIPRTGDGVIAEIKGDTVVPCGTLPADHPHALVGNTVVMMFDFRQLYELKCPTPKPLAIPNKGKQLGGFAVDTTTTPIQVLWIQGDVNAEGDYSNIELWSTPVSGESLEVSKSRKVANVRWGNERLLASHGYFAGVVSETQVQITRLSDGKQVTIDGEPGRFFNQAMVLEKDHIWATTQPAMKGAANMTGAVRLAFSFP